VSNNNHRKDAWIRDAIRKRFLIVHEDGSIHRCTRADKYGVLLSDEYRLVKFQTHKPTGRVFFNLTWRGHTKSVLVNRVVALALIPNPTNLEQVNHIDGDKANNAKSNLEWASGSDNEKHAHRTGLKSGRGSANSNAKLNAENVEFIRKSSMPVNELAKMFGVSRSTITNIITHKSWVHI
jgi:hypothetical protein